MVDIAEGRLVASEKAKLRKVLRRFDLVLFTACAIVGLDSVAGPGPRSGTPGPGQRLRSYRLAPDGANVRSWPSLPVM